MSLSFYKRLKNRVQRLLGGKSAGIYQIIRGKKNVVETDGAKISGMELDIVGDNNRVLVERGSVLSNVRVRIRGSGHCIEFGENCRISRGAVLWFEDHNGLLQVGPGTTMVEVHIAVTEMGSKVTIGEDCMFANDIDIRTGDSHSVIDAQTGERLNYAGDVVIGRHVWIAPHTVILKGVNIGDNSIIASGAVVTKSCESGVIIGGNPAKVIKMGVSWKRERISRRQNEF
ncbi:MAG: acyltransferase [Chloroflexota bacterium]